MVAVVTGAARFIVAGKVAGLTRAVIGTSANFVRGLCILLGIAAQLRSLNLCATGLGLRTASVGLGLGGQSILLGGGDAILLRLVAELLGALALLLLVALAIAAGVHDSNGDRDADEHQDSDTDDDDDLKLIHAANGRPGIVVTESR